MAKKGGSGKTYQSKGERPNVTKSVSKACRRDYVESGQRMINQIKAFKAGKNVVMTIPNPNTNETNKRFVRVNAKDLARNHQS